MGGDKSSIWVTNSVVVSPSPARDANRELLVEYSDAGLIRTGCGSGLETVVEVEVDVVTGTVVVVVVLVVVVVPTGCAHVEPFGCAAPPVPL